MEEEKDIEEADERLDFSTFCHTVYSLHINLSPLRHLWCFEREEKTIQATNFRRVFFLALCRMDHDTMERTTKHRVDSGGIVPYFCVSLETCILFGVHFDIHGKRV